MALLSMAKNSKTKDGLLNTTLSSSMAVEARDYAAAIHYEKDPDARKAFTTIEHYAPLLYVLGTVDPDDDVAIVNDEETLGSISMTGYLFQPKKSFH